MAEDLDPTFSEVLELAFEAGESDVWAKMLALEYVPAGERARAGKAQARDLKPDRKLRSRDLFTYGLVLCERISRKADSSPRRSRAAIYDELWKLEVIFDVARKMQFPSGNFKWHWSDDSVKDRNAVDFCMRGAALICAQHADLLKRRRPRAWKMLRRIVKQSVKALSRRVHEKHTNIALLNAFDLIVIGETFDWQKVAQSGYRRLDRLVIYTWEWGVHEFASPTYTAIQMVVSALIRKFARDGEARNQAEAIFRLVLRLGARNWSPSTGAFSGTRSRRLWNYLHGDARLDEVLWVIGWPDINTLPETEKPVLRIVYSALAFLGEGNERLREDINEIFNEELTTVFAEMDADKYVAQESWGPTRNESRSFFSSHNSSLSVSSTSFDSPAGQDQPLVAEIRTREPLESQPEFGVNDLVLCRDFLIELSLANEDRKDLAWRISRDLDSDLLATISEQLGQTVDDPIPWDLRSSIARELNRLSKEADLSADVDGSLYGSEIQKLLRSIADDALMRPTLNRRLIRTALKGIVAHGAAAFQAYFLADTEGDPYGRNQWHHVPTEWAAAHHESDALCLALYRSKRRDRLQSHIVFPLVDGSRFRIGGSDLLAVAGDKFPWNKSFSRSLDAEDSTLIWQHEAAAVGVKILWSGNTKGGWAPVSVHYDASDALRQSRDSKIQALRLSVDHHELQKAADGRGEWLTSGLLFWISTYDADASSESFDQWRVRLETSQSAISVDGDPRRVSNSFSLAYQGRKLADRVRDSQIGSGTPVEIGLGGLHNRRRHIYSLQAGVDIGQDMKLQIDAHSENGHEYFSRITPEPTRFIMDDGQNMRDQGRKLLEGKGDQKVSTLNSYTHLWNVTEIGVSSKGSREAWTDQEAYWESEEGRVVAPMETQGGRGREVSRYVCLPDGPRGNRRHTDVGSVTWKLRMNPDRNYFIWARVLAPHQRNRLIVRFSGFFNDTKNDRLNPLRDIHDLAVWSVPTAARWKWIPLDMTETIDSPAPTAIRLRPHTEEADEGVSVYMRVFGRDSGIKIDRLFITTKQDHLPRDNFKRLNRAGVSRKRTF
jgi:hypothetical protein